MAICGVALILRYCGVPQMYASFLRISGALHLTIFEQPGKDNFFSSLFVRGRSCSSLLNISTILKLTSLQIQRSRDLR